jgi:plasmid stability protein
MGAILNLPNELYEKIRKKASREGFNVEEYAIDILKRQVMGKKKNSKGLSQLNKVVQTMRLKNVQLPRNEAEKLDRELRNVIKHSKLHFPSLEQAMSWSRGYPWGGDDSD